MTKTHDTLPLADFTEAALQMDVEDVLVDPQSHEERTKLLLDKTLEKLSDNALTLMDKFFTESEMFDRSKPRSLMSILPKGISETFEIAFRKNPDLLVMYLERDDARFERLTKPTTTDHLLRASFWNEYTRAQNQGDTMRPHYIYESVCPRDHFYRIIQRSHRAMWILTPPEDQAAQMQVLMEKGMRRLDEILSLPITVNGKINMAVANLIMKTAIVLDVRLRGQAIQKVEITNKHEVRMTDADIDKKLRELEKEEAEIRGVAINPKPDYKADFNRSLEDHTPKELNQF